MQFSVASANYRREAERYTALYQIRIYIRIIGTSVKQTFTEIS